MLLPPPDGPALARLLGLETGPEEAVSKGHLDGGRPHLGPPPVPTLPLPEGGRPHPVSGRPRSAASPVSLPLSRGGREGRRERGPGGEGPVLIAVPDPRVAALLASVPNSPAAETPSTPRPDLPAPAAADVRLRQVLERLDGTAPRVRAAVPVTDLPSAVPDLPLTGGLRGLAALAGYGEEKDDGRRQAPVIAPPAELTPEPPLPADDLAERLERLLRREARRHGIEVES